jgi:hypothetical protein
MSDPLRIAVAVEGETDEIILRAVFGSLLGDTDFEFQTVQPEKSEAFSSTGMGWVGIYRWSRLSVSEGGGSLSGSEVLKNHDLLIHVDADVAGKTYSSGSIQDMPRDDLPCELPCPPAHDTTDALGAVVLNWLGESAIPPQVVLCTPSKSIETWVLAAICPGNRMVKRDDWECRPNPEGQLATLPKKQRFQKRPADYKKRQVVVTAAWRKVSSRLTEAARFEDEFLEAVSEEKLLKALSDQLAN